MTKYCPSIAQVVPNCCPISPQVMFKYCPSRSQEFAKKQKLTKYAKKMSKMTKKKDQNEQIETKFSKKKQK